MSQTKINDCLDGNITRRIFVSTGERPFKCDVESCGKRFTRNEELTRHKRIHTGVRPYSCVFCKKRFGRKDHLKKHMRTHEVRDSYRVSTTALGVIASLSYPFQQTTELSPYLYQIWRCIFDKKSNTTITLTVNKFVMFAINVNYILTLRKFWWEFCID